MHVERFAPSPTGPLHLGHAFSALTAWNQAQDAQGLFLLRIEDIDQTRARPEWEAQIQDDLRWLGLRWPQPVRRQSEHLDTYRKAIADLWARGLLYKCTCNRSDIAAAAAPQEGGSPLQGPDGIVYPRSCATRYPRSGPLPGIKDAVLRLDMQRAATALTGPLMFHETGAAPQGEHGPISFKMADVRSQIGDIVLARRGQGTSYHLSVVVDDALQNITHVTRGQDLFEATKIHVVLQHLLNLPTPIYHHHRLIRDDHGKRLAKRHDAKAISKYRAEGATPADLRAMVGL